MILHVIKRNLALLNVGERQYSNFIGGVQSHTNHDNNDRAAMRKRIQVAYKISALEAEGQIAAAESRRQKLTLNRTAGLFFWLR